MLLPYIIPFQIFAWNLLTYFLFSLGLTGTEISIFMTAAVDPQTTKNVFFEFYSPLDKCSFMPS